jgi:predicted nucleotide-binding protein (sugar kinase/HSP70/actin superfamily)
MLPSSVRYEAANRVLAKVHLLSACFHSLLSSVNMEAVCSSETSVKVYQTARRRILDDHTFPFSTCAL